MEEKRTSNKSLMAVSLLLLSVVAILIVLFVLRPTEAREGIVLPDPQTEPAQEQVQQQPNAGGFLELNAENVIRVLDSLNKPEYYRQTFSVTVDSGKTASERIVEIWVNGSWIHGEVRDGSSVKSVFSDGTEAWIWYNHDLQPAVFPLSQNLLLEDLLGIPNFDYQNTLRKAELLDAGYAYREEDLLQYVYVQTTAPSAAEWEFRFADYVYSNLIRPDVENISKFYVNKIDNIVKIYNERVCMENSHSWKITKPLRKVMSFIKRR